MPRGIPNDKSHKRKVLHHLKTANGHLNRVIKMVEDDEYCIDVIHQSLAVQSALKNVDQEVLRNHLETCVADSIKDGNTDEVIGEVMRVIQKT